MKPNLLMKHPFRNTYLLWVMAFVPLLLQTGQSVAQISITQLGTDHVEGFNTLVSSGSSSTVPTGWAFLEVGGDATYAASNGGGNTGNTYSYGSTGSSERAFGCLLSGTVTPTLGVRYTNNTGNTINHLIIDYRGEQWRLGALAREDRLDFQYSLNATALNNGTWVNVNQLDFVAPVTTGTIGALNGNNAPNFTNKSFTITGLSIPNGATFWFRWLDFNATSNDDGLAIDSFTLNACAVVTCPPNNAACLNTPPFNVGNGNPTGGVFTGPGMTGNMFNPAVAGTGTHIITYSYDSGTCEGSCTFTINVASSLNVDAGTYPPACVNGPNVNLVGTPPGGSWSGLGVSGNQFDPSAGTQTVTYTYTGAGGCSGTDQVVISVIPCLQPPEMRWILLNDEGQQNGSCTSTSNCDINRICFGLQYTPNVTGSLTSYTTGFFVNCVAGLDPVVSQASCVMTNNSAFTNDCANSGLLLWQFSANTGTTPVQQGVPKVVHQVCFNVPNTGTITLEEDQITDLTTSIDLAGGGFTAEKPGYTTFTIEKNLYCALLPVEFLSFEVVESGPYTALLDWKTAQEINNSHFEVQRSNDQGRTFVTIGQVDALTTPRSVYEYQFTDPHALPGINYYRLKQFDIDGQFGYSPIRSVIFKHKAFAVQTWPNPAKDVLNVNIELAGQAGEIEVMDMSGRRIAQIFFEEGDSAHLIPVDQWMPGMYTLIVKSGAEQHLEKIVVVK